MSFTNLITRVGLGLALGASAAIASPAAPPVSPAPATPTAETPPAAPAVTPESQAAAKAAFAQVYSVLMHPRCMNCHPAGDKPLQTDASVPHAMNISRASLRNGMTCSTCHREVNSEALGMPGGPPGAPHWGLPAADMPLIFEGRTPASLCAQLKDPAQNGNRTLADLLHHVEHDALVKWGWAPGGTRSVPPMSHADFVAAFVKWIAGGAACPE